MPIYKQRKIVHLSVKGRGRPIFEKAYFEESLSLNFLNAGVMKLVVKYLQGQSFLLGLFLFLKVKEQRGYYSMIKSTSSLVETGKLSATSPITFAYFRFICQ